MPCYLLLEISDADLLGAAVNLVLGSGCVREVARAATVLDLTNAPAVFDVIEQEVGAEQRANRARAERRYGTPDLRLVPRETVAQCVLREEGPEALPLPVRPVFPRVPNLSGPDEDMLDAMREICRSQQAPPDMPDDDSRPDVVVTDDDGDDTPLFDAPDREGR